MHLIFDFGNTTAKYAIFNKWEFIENGIVDGDFAIAKLPYSIEKCIIGASGLIHQPIEQELISLHIPYFQINSDTKIPITNLYKTPETLGSDRLAAAIGACIEFKNCDRLIINAGTCLTYDFITSADEYLGGAISPGMKMRYKSMHQFTARLPYIEENSSVNPLIGTNTEECMKSGVVNGIIAEIRGFIQLYLLKYPMIKPVLTGGDAEFLESQMKNEIFVSKFLVLKGLNAVLIHNEV